MLTYAAYVRADFFCTIFGLKQATKKTHNPPKSLNADSYSPKLTTSTWKSLMDK